MRLNIYKTKAYKNGHLVSVGKTNPIQSQYKANQSQNKPNFRKAKMNVTSILTKDYENERLCRYGENKPNSKPIKPNTNPTCSELVEPIPEMSK